MLNLAAHCSCLGMGGQEKYRPMRAEPWTLPQLMVSPATTLGAMFCYWVCLFLDMLPLWHLAPLLCFLYLAKGDTEGFSFFQEETGLLSEPLLCGPLSRAPHSPTSPSGHTLVNLLFTQLQWVPRVYRAAGFPGWLIYALEHPQLLKYFQCCYCQTASDLLGLRYVANADNLYR